MKAQKKKKKLTDGAVLVIVEVDDGPGTEVVVRHDHQTRNKVGLHPPNTSKPNYLLHSNFDEGSHNGALVN